MPQGAQNELRPNFTGPCGDFFRSVCRKETVGIIGIPLGVRAREMAANTDEIKYNIVPWIVFGLRMLNTHSPINSKHANKNPPDPMIHRGVKRDMVWIVAGCVCCRIKKTADIPIMNAMARRNSVLGINDP